MKIRFLAICCSLICASVHADVAALQANLKQKYPQLQVKHVQPTAIAGLYSANLDGSVVYLSEDAEFIVASGVMIRLKDQHNLTQDLVLEQNRIDWNKLPLNDAIKTVQGNGQQQLAVFSDPNCPYCQRLEAELAQLENVTIYTFMLPIKPQSVSPSQAVWCAKDRSQVWHDLIAKGITPKAQSCANPIQRNLQLAKSLDIQGTPVIIFANGFMSQGFHNHEDIEQLWQDLGL